MQLKCIQMQSYSLGKRKKRYAKKSKPKLFFLLSIKTPKIKVKQNLSALIIFL